jgi:hypothetical protein
VLNGKIQQHSIGELLMPHNPSLNLLVQILKVGRKRPEMVRTMAGHLCESAHHVAKEDRRFHYGGLHR